MRILSLILLCLVTALHADIDPHHFYFFYKDQSDRTAAMEKVVDQVVEQLSGQVTLTKVQVTDPNEKALVERFNLKRSPIPFTLVLADNGAITGGHPISVTQEQLQNSLSSTSQANSLKALQDKKLVFLCVHQGDVNAMRGVHEFASDPRFSKATEIIQANPTDIREHKFLQQLGVDTQPREPITVLLAPPAKVVGTYVGATNKGQFISDLETASKGCCPGGCCANGCCTPK